MTMSRREYRVLEAIEIDLMRDPYLRDVFEIPPPSARRQVLLAPSTWWASCLISLALQAAVAGVCAFGAGRGKMLLIAFALSVYPFALLPLIRWSRRTDVPSCTLRDDEQ
ncbi:MAG: hypothetical protein ACR2JU_01830 [Nocardioidaceae bacterium]